MTGIAPDVWRGQEDRDIDTALDLLDRMERARPRRRDDDDDAVMSG